MRDNDGNPKARTPDVSNTGKKMIIFSHVWRTSQECTISFFSTGTAGMDIRFQCYD